MIVENVQDYRFTLSDGTKVWIIVKGTPDERVFNRLRESVNRLEGAIEESGVLRAHDVRAS